MTILRLLGRRRRPALRLVDLTPQNPVATATVDQVDQWAEGKLNEAIEVYRQAFGAPALIVRLMNQLSTESELETYLPSRPPAPSLNVSAALLAPTGNGRCRVCGCTDADCSRCIGRTGKPCHWVQDDLCSACEFSPEASAL